MDRFLKSQYNGFRLDDTLASRLKFSGIVSFSEISERFSKRDGEEVPYWVLKDEFGARFSCFDSRLISGIRIFERCEVRGEIKIGKGGTFLNIKECVTFSGEGYTEVEN